MQRTKHTRTAIKIIITIVIILSMVSSGCGSNEKQNEEASNNESVPSASKDGIYALDIMPFWKWRSNRNWQSAGNIITFGEWKGKPIEWRVLDIQDDKVLVTSIDLLALRQYQERPFEGTDGTIDYYYATWSESPLRAWLNNDFYQTAFSGQEKQEISLTTVKTPESERIIVAYYDGSSEIYDRIPIQIRGSEDAEDKIFCLSVEEAELYFNWDVMRVAYMAVTQEEYDYAVQAAASIGYDTDSWTWTFAIGYELNEISPKMWWLRNGTYVSPYGMIWLGSVSGDGEIPCGWPCGVRPTMWLQLDADGEENVPN